jgi:hypothetical protein
LAPAQPRRPNAKSTTAQIVDTCGNLETYSVIDKDIADLNGNTAEFRLSESRAFLEGMSQQVAATLIYGNQFINPERFTGFAPRYSTVNHRLLPDRQQRPRRWRHLLDQHLDLDQRLGHRHQPRHLPQGQDDWPPARDMGEWPVTDASGNTYQAYREHFKWEIGLVQRDWRYTVRIANIDVTQLTGVSAANLINLLVRGSLPLPTAAGLGHRPDLRYPRSPRGHGPTVIYCNRVIRTYLDLQAMNKTNVLLRLEEFNGKPVTTFRGIPVRTVDAILNNESRVV